MGGAFSTHRKRREMLTKFWSENLKGRDHLEDLGVGGRIILEGILGEYLVIRTQDRTRI
jgi:hypothetical protein